ncbi:hypothetical protein O181_109252 [Austropuccinia psidii MF-1]|uniref:Uncharacterized protein n=1 Tax=Austropuccinia psidii MF-1 TaxID=1389203 RepID=A0A9Q3JXI2_9BASI|nr:hypothetical protein [Austropuccinia psidii MF-1]
MSDLNNSSEPKHVSSSELNSLLTDAQKGLTLNDLSPCMTHQPNHLGKTILEAQFNTNTDLSDVLFEPATTNDGWDGNWVPAHERVIIDSHALDFINKKSPHIWIPTWIKHAIPVLGKTSFGRLKADEWQRLFTVQLPLIMQVLWKDSIPKTISLLHNFAHLVSFVNIASKQSTSAERIQCYCDHIISYLEGCLIIFHGVKLAPNHHMAIHLAECMERFGPTQSYWSFSMERLMGQIWKAGHNNRLGWLFFGPLSFQTYADHC